MQSLLQGWNARLVPILRSLIRINVLFGLIPENFGPRNRELSEGHIVSGVRAFKHSFMSYICRSSQTSVLPIRVTQALSCHVSISAYYLNTLDREVLNLSSSVSFLPPWPAGLPFIHFEYSCIFTIPWVNSYVIYIFKMMLIGKKRTPLSVRWTMVQAGFNSDKIV